MFLLGLAENCPLDLDQREGDTFDERHYIRLAGMGSLSKQYVHLLSDVELVLLQFIPVDEENRGLRLLATNKFGHGDAESELIVHRLVGVHQALGHGGCGNLSDHLVHGLVG